MKKPSIRKKQIQDNVCRSPTQPALVLFALLLAAATVALPASADVDQTPSINSRMAPSGTVPNGFREYGSNAIADGTCVAGDVTNEGLDGRAVVYVKDAKTKKTRWVTSIPLPADWYQNRATHCFMMGDYLYVLIQSDTSQRTSISQTLLNVVELSPQTGKVISNRDADVPGVDAAYSSWVEKGNEGFREDKGQVRISGEYFLMNNAGKRLPFTVTLPAHASK